MLIFSQVATGCSSLRALSWTQPVVPLGRIGSRTRSHTRSLLSVVRASTRTRSSVPSPVLRVSLPTVLAVVFGAAFAGTAFSTNP